MSSAAIDRGEVLGRLIEALDDARTATRTTAPDASSFLDSLAQALQARPLPDVGEPAEALSDALLAATGPEPEARTLLAELLSFLARRVASDDVPPPAEAPAAQLWRAVSLTAARLYGSGVRSLGRPAFVSDALLDLLRREANEQLEGRRAGDARVTVAAGRALASLAVSRRLRESMSDALGIGLVPSYSAVYCYDPPGSSVRTHIDAADYDVVFHLVLDEEPSGGTCSRLVVHDPDAIAPLRIAVPAGDAVALRGRGTLHAWEQLGPDESRTLTAIGFAIAS